LKNYNFIYKENTMDDKTRNLISLGASIAANCVPCFEHYYQLAGKNGISNAEVEEVVKIAEKVKHGAATATKQCACDIMAGDESPLKCASPCCG
jgi:AhpD family alkylhydroperoxidase